MALQGNLVDLPLFDLVQVLTLQNKTGVLSLNRDFSQAQVTFSKSKIYAAYVHHASHNGKSIYKQGEDALYDLLGWPDGQFTFELTNALPAVENVQLQWDQLILEYCRRSDENEQKQRLHELISARPRLVPNPPMQAEITLDLEQWRVLFQVNGVLTIKEIATSIRQDPREVAEIATKLEKKGLIMFERTAQPDLYPANYKTYYEASAEARSNAANRSQTTLPANSFGSRALVGASSPPALTAPTASRALPAKFGPETLQFQPVGAPDRSVPAPNKPKVHRGVLSGIMAKIRGL